MNRIKAFVLSFLCAFVATKTFSQTEIPINLYTGVPGISINLGGISGHGVYDNVSLVYSTQGLTLQGRGGEFGLGWSLVTSEISREVRGLPDEYAGGTGDPRRGWLQSSCNVSVGNFTVSSDNNLSICTDEASDYNFIDMFAGSGWDSEPDIYRYSLPNGLSGSFVFDNGATPSVRLIPYADIKVDVEFVSNNINRFVITTNDGNRYVFNTKFEMATYTWPEIVADVVRPVYFQTTDFNLYNLITRPEVEYVYEWALDSVKSVGGGYLFYQYLSKELTEAEKAKFFSNSDLSFESFGYSVGYSGDGHRRKRLVAITSSSGSEVKFIHKNDLLQEVVHNDYRKTGNPFVKRYTISYDRYKVCSSCSAWPDFDGGTVDTTFRWSFLKSVTEESLCSKLPPYEFTYTTPQKYPAPVRRSFDAWGYYNYLGTASLNGKLYVYPSLPPHERYRIFLIEGGNPGQRYDISMRSMLPVQDSAQIGVIRTLKFPAGGSAILDWELHEFYDSIAGHNQYAGGLRVKTVTYSDGIDPQKNLVTQYTYQVNGKSTGKLLMQPKFIIPTDDQKTSDSPLTLKSYSTIVQQGGNPWLLLARKSYTDLTGGNTSVVYASVKVSKVGQGYVVSEFTTPATWGQSTSGEWEASTVKIARSAPCNSVEFISTGTHNIYPFPPNPDYSFAQGLPASERVYSEQGVLLRETTYSYKPIYKGTASHKVWGLRYEKVPYWTDGYLFSKYFLLTDVGRVISTVTTKEFDATDVLRYVQTSSSYEFETGPHRLLKKIEQTHADGSKTTHYFRYPLDYGTIQLPASGAVTMISKLQQSFRNGRPLEERTTVTVGGIENTVAASTSILDGFGGSKPLTKHMLSLKAVELPNFVPSYIQNGELIVDNRYDTTTTVLSYSPYLEPLSVISDDRINRGSIKGYNNTVTVASISNALPEQMAFSDFETTTPRSFDANGALTMGAARSGKSSIQPTVTLSKQLQRGGDQYILSGWLLKNQNVTLNLRVKNVAKTQTYHSQAISFTAGGSKFEYFENTFPVDASLTDFVVEIECTVPTPGTPMPLLDDIAVYPAQADMGSSTFDIPFGATSTTSRDKTGYVVYDDLGRLSVSKDKDGNILQKNTYYFPGMVPPTLQPSISFPSPVYLSQPTVFMARTNTCVAGYTFQWDFGSGYVNGTETMSNTFTSAGQKTVKVKMTHPTEGTVERTETVDVVLGPDQTARFTYTPMYVAGTKVTFTATEISIPGSTVTYEWNFGQGYEVRPRVTTQTMPASGPVFLRVSITNFAVPQQVYKGIVFLTIPN